MARATAPGPGPVGGAGGAGEGPGDAGRRGGSRRWLVLAAGTVALTAGSTFQYGLAYLIPALRAHGLSLEEAGVLVACPTAGLLLTLVAWGAAADRWGERLVLTSGLAAAGAVLLAATQAHTTAMLAACLVAAGAAALRCTRRAGGSSSPGSRPPSAAWRWASGKAPSRSESRWRR